MKKLLIEILFLTLITNSSYCQSDTIDWIEKHVQTQKTNLCLTQRDKTGDQKIYRIWFNDYQVIELIQRDSSEFNGQLINYIRKTNKKYTNNKTLKECLTIPNNVVESLFNQLYNFNIETIIDCREIDGYVQGCDGGSVTFEIISFPLNRIYYYWEPDNDLYQDKSNPYVANVRKILNAISKEIDLLQLYKNYLDSLGPGIYHYGMIIMTKR